MNRFNMKKIIALKALALFLACSMPAAAQYYGGALKPHGHTKNSDGGVITNLTITGKLSATGVTNIGAPIISSGTNNKLSLSAGDGSGDFELYNIGGRRWEQTNPKVKARINWGDASIGISRNLDLKGIEFTTSTTHEYYVLDDTSTTGSLLEIGKAGIQGYLAADLQTSSVTFLKAFSFAHYPIQHSAWANIMSSTTFGDDGGYRPVNNISILTPIFTSGTSPALGTAGGGLGIFNSTGTYGLQIGPQGDGGTFLQSGRIDGAATAYDIVLNPLGGKIGIGTAIPTQKLDISSGTIKIAGTASPAKGAALCLTAAGVMGTCTGGTLTACTCTP